MRLRVPVRDELRNAPGAPVHGGVYAALTDMAVGGALSTMHEASAGGVGQTTLDMNVSFIGRQHRRRLRGRAASCGAAAPSRSARPPSPTAAGKLLAVGRATYMILAK